MAEPQPREQSRLRSRVRYFWSRRSGARTMWALVLAVLALLAAIYLALPSGDQRTVIQAGLAEAQRLGATGLTVSVEIVLIICALASFMLVLAPGYRTKRYLTLPATDHAQTSVYLDLENVRSPQDIQAIVDRLRRDFADRRLNLLYFASALSSAGTFSYKMLYRYGFRPIDVPHDPTGTNLIKEAVDKEIAMHALERALVGLPGQEFIIIAIDGGYVPLAYRLVALGHHVQIWSPHLINAYRTLATYLPITLVDLSQGVKAQNVKPERVAQGRVVARQANLRVKAGAHKNASIPEFTLHDPPVAQFAQAGAAELYYAIYQTIELCTWIEANYVEDAHRLEQLHLHLATTLAPCLAVVGYTAFSSNAYWLRHLNALNVLNAPEGSFPERGSISAEAAARQLYAMALTTAQAAVAAVSNRSDNALNMQVIHAQLMRPELASDDTRSLYTLLAPNNQFRYTHIRYFIHCARALKLLEYDDVSSSRDLITSPNLTELARQAIERTAE